MRCCCLHCGGGRGVHSETEDAGTQCPHGTTEHWELYHLVQELCLDRACLKGYFCADIMRGVAKDKIRSAWSDPGLNLSCSKTLLKTLGPLDETFHRIAAFTSMFPKGRPVCVCVTVSPHGLVHNTTDLSPNARLRVWFSSTIATIMSVPNCFWFLDTCAQSQETDWQQQSGPSQRWWVCPSFSWSLVLP